MNNDPNYSSPRRGEKKRTFILNKLQENYETNQKVKAKSSLDLVNIQKVMCTPKNSDSNIKDNNLASPAMEINSSFDINKPKPKPDIIRQQSKPHNDVKLEERKDARLEIKMDDKKKKAKCFLFKCFG